MIPRITDLEQCSKLCSQYLQALRQEGFKGDLDSSRPGRLLCATDNSVYQCMPQAVVFPRDEDDIALALKIRARDQFKSIVVSPRGGGTGTNGQSLTAGVVIDCSRHMRGVRDLDAEKRQAWVQAGVIKDELNEMARKHGLFFSPELSTSSRATVGGMCSDDAAGQGSLKYGRTSSHVKAVRVVLIDGSRATFGPVSGSELEKRMALQNLEGEIYRKAVPLLKRVRGKADEIFPKLNRFMTGYDFRHAYDPETGTVNLARLVCGAEGTLCAISEVLLDLTELPSFRELIVVKYENFVSALRNARDLIAAGALSVETVDSKVLGLARQDSVWLSVKDYIREVPGHEISGINIVEFSGNDAKAEKAKADALFASLQKRAESCDGGILGAQLVTTPQGIAAVYGMRKKSVGLLANAAGRRKLVAFTEDTVVPPENLADYILEFRALLDSKGVPYGMFGHVDTGLMHVRPALDLTTDEDRRNLVEISEGVSDLVKKYGGQMWGEHGRGYRSCFGEKYFGELYPAAREVKEIFDPDNVLNPGKICVPLHNDKDHLVAIDSLMRGDLDRKVPISVRDSFRGAFACNGNGQCFSYSTAALMCPSYRCTRDRARSPKGYSELMRDWIGILNARGFSPMAEEASAMAGSSLLSWPRRLFNTLFRKDGDYSSEIMEKIRTCLACKSCKGICPTHVNAADLNSRFISMYYSRYLRPSMDLLTLNAEWLIPLGAKFPRLSNAALKSKAAKSLMRALFSLEDLPLFCERQLKDLCSENGIPLLSTRAALNSKPDVAIVADPFTAAYEGQGLMALARLVRSLGFSVGILKPYVNGKLMSVRGARRKFVRFASKQAGRLQALAGAGISLVGYDPALTICYRDEYQDLLGASRGDFSVLLPEEWLSSAIASERGSRALSEISAKVREAARSEKFGGDWYLFSHCTEAALLPKSVQDWQSVMSSFGLTLVPVPVACCGMAGLHGHMTQNLEESRRVYEQNWKPRLEARKFERCLATGYSCRSQVERMEGRPLMHPVMVLDKLLEAASHGKASAK
jgi:FAD/FMN-containing dehydrogenase/Fe-S oxidoreductase